jgi:hypothetical protein
MRLNRSATTTDDKRTWLYAFAIMLIVSIATLGTRFLLGPFLATDFEIVVIYLPTVLAGLITFYLRVKFRHA